KKESESLEIAGLEIPRDYIVVKGGKSMLVNDIWFNLKDGRKAVLRSPKDEDIEGMLEYLYVSAGETEFILRYPEECSKYTPEGEKALFDRVNASDNEAMLVCVVDGKVAGNCQIMMKKGLKTKHRASVAIALVSEFWNQGIGTRMFQEMIHIAESNKDILQMELEFVEGNVRARHLYEKMGFRITGVHPNAIRLKDGTLLNEYTMIKEIKR
ncbi:MAG: GNAT family N-acetyltransferase, partial [Lachnospiraceae bacterium]